MRYFILLFTAFILTFPTFADDMPEIIEVARFGRGTAYTLAWRPDGEVLAVGSSTGVWFFDEGFNELGRLVENMQVGEIHWSPDGLYLLALSLNGNNCEIKLFDYMTSNQISAWDIDTTIPAHYYATRS